MTRQAAEDSEAKMEGDLTLELIVTGIGVAVVVAVLVYVMHRIALRLVHFWRQLS